MSAGTPNAERFLLGPDHSLVRLQGPARMVGLAALVLALLGAFLDPAQFFRSYLTAYLFWLGIALGSLAILMLQHITGGTWGVVIRRSLESATRTLPLMAVLFLPLLLGLGHLYEWANPEHVAHDPILQHKSIYLNVPFFLVRAVLYFSVWLTLMYFLNRWSAEQDAGADVEKRLEYVSRGGLLLFTLTMTFASIDWAMSLEPHWFSTIYGILFIGGQVLSAWAFVIPVLVLIAERPPFSAYITADQFHDLGKLLLGFVMIWSYFAFSQFLIIWAGNLPEETPWYLSRLHGGWEWIGGAEIVAHFALPFLVLLSRDLKRNGPMLAAVALGVLFMRFVDLFWMIQPAFSPGEFTLHWLDLVTLVGVGGLWLSQLVGQLKARPALPLREPQLVLEAA
jgi:hypothetical protein